MDAVFDAFVAEVPGPVVDGRKPLPEDPELVQIAATCPLPGAHNRQNAELALRMACRLGVPRAALAAAMASFPGVERRLQRVGTWRDATHQVDVFDDYAHNPEKLHAMLVTLQEAYPAGVAAVWRPHGYAPLRKMADALADMFRATLRPQDLLVLPPVYDAGGTADRSVNSGALAAKIGNSVYLGTPQEAVAFLRAQAPALGAIVTAGARDPELPVMARRLAGKE
jgi:UDP-N-acetylmuramate--alanine ligase